MARVAACSCTTNTPALTPRIANCSCPSARTSSTRTPATLAPRGPVRRNASSCSTASTGPRRARPACRRRRFAPSRARRARARGAGWRRESRRPARSPWRTRAPPGARRQRERQRWAVLRRMPVGSCRRPASRHAKDRTRARAPGPSAAGRDRRLSPASVVNVPNVQQRSCDLYLDLTRASETRARVDG